MKKILIAFMALFAISMNTYAQHIEHKFSGNHSKEEWNGVVSDRLNPFILERVNGGDKVACEIYCHLQPYMV